MRPSLVVRPAFFAALASPFFRRSVVASSKLPLASSRAALQSIIPAPVWSRSFFTSAALIAMAKPDRYRELLMIVSDELVRNPRVGGFTRIRAQPAGAGGREAPTPPAHDRQLANRT